MGVLDTLKNIADGADAVKKIHDTGKAFGDQYIAPAVKAKPQPHPLTIHVPANTKVNEPVTISGTGTGLITLYSADVEIRKELYPDSKGNWYAREYFSEAGTYILKAKDYYDEVETTVNITP